MASAIVRDLATNVREDVFAVMADETRDSAGTEQVAICLRSVNKQLEVEEQLIGLYSVESTSALVLSTVIKDALLRLGLDLTQLRGQCYDGAANMVCQSVEPGSDSSAVPEAGDMPFLLVVCMWGGGGWWDWELLRSSVNWLSLVSLIMYSFKLYITLHMRAFVVPVLHNSIFQTRYVCSSFIVLPFV